MPKLAAVGPAMKLEPKTIAERPGGAVRTQELTLPGFRHDSCGTAHVIPEKNDQQRHRREHAHREGRDHWRHLMLQPTGSVSGRAGSSPRKTASKASRSQAASRLSESGAPR